MGSHETKKLKHTKGKILPSEEGADYRKSKYLPAIHLKRD